MRCQDCGAPCAPSTIVCPFCGFEVGVQRVSDRQRLILRWSTPFFRILVLLFLILFAKSGGDLSNFAWYCGLGGIID